MGNALSQRYLGKVVESAPDASLLSSRHEGDIPVTISVFLQTGHFGVQILLSRRCCDFLVPGTGMFIRCNIIIFLQNFEMSTHASKFSALCALDLVRIVIKC